MADALPRLTLDTNCIINLFDAGSATRTSVEELQALIQAALAGKAELSVTTRVEVDLSNDSDAARRNAILDALKLFPVVGTIGRWDTSTWGSGDVYAGKDTQALISELQRIVFPALAETDKRYRNKINDIDHLVGHLLNKRDIFITDDGDIIKKKDTLKKSLGLVVMRPADALQFVDARAERALRVAPKVVDGYHTPALSGRVTFDYSNNDGRYVIGDGLFAIETRWSKASSWSIHAYKDSTTTDVLAIAKGCQKIEDITDASIFDFTSRVRTPERDQIVVWRNANGIYGATRIVDIKDDKRGAASDELTFEYVILGDGAPSFAR